MLVCFGHRQMLNLLSKSRFARVFPKVFTAVLAETEVLDKMQSGNTKSVHPLVGKSGLKNIYKAYVLAESNKLRSEFFAQLHEARKHIDYLGFDIAILAFVYLLDSVYEVFVSFYSISDCVWDIRLFLIVESDRNYRI